MSRIKSGTISPAYGRDYKNKVDAVKDFNIGKDFILHNADGKSCHTYCSTRDFALGAEINLHYWKKSKVVVFVKTVEEE